MKKISDDFEHVVWQRLQSASPARKVTGSQSLALCAVASVAVMAVFIIMANRRRPIINILPSQATIRVPELIVRRGERPQDSLNVSSPASEPPGRGATKRVVVRSKRSRIAQITKKHSKKRTPVPGKTIRRTQQLASASKQNAAKSTAKIIPSWEQWAKYYESLGDYRSAERAYVRAAVQSGNPGLTFKAGQAAEQAGDVAQAIQYYSNLLKAQSEQQKQPEKGSRIWTQEQDSA